MTSINSNAEKISPGKIRGVLFDYEGTLVDFQWKLDDAVNETFALISEIGFLKEWYGYSPDYAAIYNMTQGMHAHGKSSHEIASAMEIINRIYDRYDADALTRWSLYPETLNTLRMLLDGGFRMGLVTSVGRICIQKALPLFSLDGCFENMVTRNDVLMLKPHHEGLVKGLKSLGMEPGETIFVGDSRNDVAAARAADMAVCYLRGGERWPYGFPKLSADIEISSLDQILPLLSR